MNNNSGSERGDGIGCLCEARSAGECACGADWTPKEVYKLRGELSHLQKLCEEQRVEIAELKEQRDALYDGLFDENGELIQRKFVSDLQKRRNSLKEENEQLLSQLAEQTERVSRLEGALRYMLYDRTTAGLHISEVCSKSAFDRAEQALNQERLGDGKWRCAHCNAWNVHDIFNCLNCEKPRPPVSLGDGGKGE